MWLIKYRIVTKYQDFYDCGRWLHHHNSRDFRAILLSETIFYSDDLILHLLKAIVSGWLFMHGSAVSKWTSLSPGFSQLKSVKILQYLRKTVCGV